MKGVLFKINWIFWCIYQCYIEIYKCVKMKLYDMFFSVKVFIEMLNK